MSLINHINNNNLEEVKNQNITINEIYNNLENKSLGNLNLSTLTATKEDIVSNKTLFINGILENGEHQCINKITSLLDKTITNIILPSSLTKIGNYAFYNCNDLTLAELPSNIINIGSRAFHGCTNLKTMKIKSKELGNGIQIFQNCSHLTKVWISSNCTSITASSASNSHFKGCPNTLEIYTDATEKLSGWGDYFNRTGSSGSIEAIVHYNVSEADFDTIVNAQ